MRIPARAEPPFAVTAKAKARSRAAALPHPRNGSAANEARCHNRYFSARFVAPDGGQTHALMTSNYFGLLLKALMKAVWAPP